MNALRGHRAVAFLDLEGTQFTHEMIELGAVLAILDPNGNVKRTFPPFRTYVKAQGQVGKIVKKLTGITDRTLAEKGVPFNEAQRLFRKYMGRYWGKAIFCTFGTHDLRIIQQTTVRSKECDHEWSAAICRCCLDFAGWLSQYVEDEHGNSLSLENYLKLFEVDFQGQAHDAQDDAWNLMLLYEAVLDRKDILEREYLKTLSRLKKTPEPIRAIVQRLMKGETVGPDDLKEEIRKYFE